MPPPRPFRVLVTRPRGQASALADLLAAAGATPILIPAIEIAAPASYDPLDEALCRLDSFDWLLFTSANAVEVFAARALLVVPPPRLPRIAAIGPATATAVERSLHRLPDLVPFRSTAEALAEALLPFAPGASMLLVRAAVARDILPFTLEAAGATLVLAEAYRNVIPQDSIARLQQLFRAHPPDAVTFTSGSTAQHLHALLQAAGLTIPAPTVLGSIGPITSQAMRDLGLKPTLEAAEATIPSLVQALLQAFGELEGAGESL